MSKRTSKVPHDVFVWRNTRCLVAEIEGIQVRHSEAALYVMLKSGRTLEFRYGNLPDAKKAFKVAAETWYTQRDILAKRCTRSVTTFKIAT